MWTGIATEMRMPAVRPSVGGRRAFLLGAIAVLLASCQGQNPAAVAKQFMNAWVVGKDRATAIDLSVGEMRRNLEANASGPDLGGLKPPVGFREVSRSTDGERSSFEFVVTGADAAGGQRGVELVLHRTGGRWRVAELRLAGSATSPTPR